jgi:hypothetical protein
VSRPPPKPGRAAREAAALRQNLLKRKDQARRREEAKQADQAEPNDKPMASAAAPIDTEEEFR